MNVPCNAVAVLIPPAGFPSPPLVYRNIVCAPSSYFNSGTSNNSSTKAIHVQSSVISCKLKSRTFQRNFHIGFARWQISCVNFWLIETWDSFFWQCCYLVPSVNSGPVLYQRFHHSLHPDIHPAGFRGFLYCPLLQRNAAALP